MSKFNSEPIDIIVPWVNPNDPAWRKDFEYWKQKETGQKDACRFRDMGVFNYWFRCIEKNMPWVRYVFLVLASPSQIPNWLNVNHPKLKIVYHDQFIPKEELPTFNSSVINCYMPFIEELSDNYILFNDDFFVVKPVNENEFFLDNTPVANFNVKGCPAAHGTPWYHNIANNCRLIENISSKKNHYIPDHGPISFNKPIQLFIWNKAKTQLTEGLHNSKFRQNKNYTDWIFFDAEGQLEKLKKLNHSIVQYINKSNTSFNKEIVCLNDNELFNDIDFMNFKKYAFEKLNIFKKSEFEK